MGIDGIECEWRYGVCVCWRDILVGGGVERKKERIAVGLFRFDVATKRTGPSTIEMVAHQHDFLFHDHYCTRSTHIHTHTQSHIPCFILCVCIPNHNNNHNHTYTYIYTHTQRDGRSRPTAPHSPTILRDYKILVSLVSRQHHKPHGVNRTTTSTNNDLL